MRRAGLSCRVPCRRGRAVLPAANTFPTTPLQHSTHAWRCLQPDTMAAACGTISSSNHVNPSADAEPAEPLSAWGRGACFSCCMPQAEQGWAPPGCGPWCCWCPLCCCGLLGLGHNSRSWERGPRPVDPPSGHQPYGATFTARPATHCTGTACQQQALTRGLLLGHPPGAPGSWLVPAQAAAHGCACKASIP